MKPYTIPDKLEADATLINWLKCYGYLIQANPAMWLTGIVACDLLRLPNQSADRPERAG